MKAIDASALLKFILREEGWRDVAEHLEEGTASIDLVIKESINAVLRRTWRGQQSLEEASTMLGVLRELYPKAIKVEDEDEYLEEATLIASNQKITIYDALYIALAKRRGIPLLTSDQRQAEAAEKEGVNTIKV
ncbi:MAG: type II toxin-antitoxin system VapC family toxin [Candidatus Bathyarchaeia archaeon]|nr:type II toxin-antitoxin system VapC family toxin [Candidatus Bathyarchaeota archaeon]